MMPRTRWLPLSVRLLALVIVLLSFAPSPAVANSTPSQRPSGQGGLVVPTRTSDVRIDRELLSVDLSDAPDPAKVTASYDLTNLAARPVSLDLAFVAPSGRDLRLALDGAALAIAEAPTAGLPGDWTDAVLAVDPLTGETYDLGGMARGWNDARAWTFSISLPAGGKASLTAEYLSPLGYDRDRHDRIVRAFTYALGPAANWAGFGELEVEVLTSTGWIAATTPALEMTMSGQSSGVARYGGKFAGVPAGTLRIGLMSSPQPLDAYAPWIGFGLPILGGIVVGPICGILFARLRRRWLAAIGALVVGGAVAMMAGLALSWSLLDILVPLSNELSDGTAMLYGAIFSTVLVGPLVGGTIAAICVLVAWPRRWGG